MTLHICARASDCCCGIAALEPAERCPVHGSGEWPPRCAECGKFMPWSESVTQADATSQETGEGVMSEIVDLRDDELLPCPHCGQPVKMQHIPPHTHTFATFMPDHPGSYFIECCGGMIDEQMNRLINTWNTRCPRQTPRVYRRKPERV